MALSNIRLTIKVLHQIILKKTIMTTTKQFEIEKTLNNLKTNIFYEKYAKKIEKLQLTSPIEFLKKIEQLNKVEFNKNVINTNRGEYSKVSNPKNLLDNLNCNYNNVYSLDKIMKIDLIKDKNVCEITEIWRQHHLEKNFISAIIPISDFNEIILNGKKYPTFLFPLPRKRGYEFIMSQFVDNLIYFTPLLNYQIHKENAPECLKIIHYTELNNIKGIVLMRGEYDSNILDYKESQCLANQIQLYYLRPSKEKLQLLETFTNKPNKFEPMKLIQQIQNLSL